MSASTVSITANPATRRRAVVATEKRSNNVELVSADPQTNKSPDDNGTKTPVNRRDLSHNSIRGEVVVHQRNSTREAVQIKKTVDNSTVSPPLNRRSRKYAPPRPLWLTVLRLSAKYCVLLVLIVGLVKMITTLASRSGDGNPIQAFSDFEGRLAEMDLFVKKTAKMMQVQVEVVDRKIQNEVEGLRRQVSEKIDEKGAVLEGKLNELEGRSKGLESIVEELRAGNWMSKEEFEKIYEALKKVDTQQVLRERRMDGSIGQGGGNVDMYLPNYKLGRRLGIGSFGKVKIAEHVLTGHKVAIKILNRSKIQDMGMEEKVRREIKVLRLFMHPHIIRLYEVIETPTDIYVVMEYVESGELFDYIVEKGWLQEDEARNFFQQIISGIEYCHRKMVVHRDLKPENLLLDSKRNIKIADFGLSNIMRDGHFLKTSCGSPNYAAPEVISRKLYAGPEVDIWSCGVILYALLCGTLPFDDENLPNLFKKIKCGYYTLSSHLSPGARDFILRMLVVDPMKRMTIPEIRQHPWFQDHLPRYLAVPPPDTMQQANKIDEDILQEVVKMGFDRNQLVESLRNRLQNECTVAYYLLLDNRFRLSSGYLGDVLPETMVRSCNQKLPSGSAASPVGQCLPEHVDYEGMGMTSKFPVERKWALGLQSRAHPHEILTEVLKALQVLHVSWKKIGHYNMKCRWIMGLPGHQEGMLNNLVPSNHYSGDESIITETYGAMNSPNVVKFEVQLYKTQEEKYLLDLQRVQGSQFLFLDLCAAFLVQLRVF